MCFAKTEQRMAHHLFQVGGLRGVLVKSWGGLRVGLRSSAQPERKVLAGPCRLWKGCDQEDRELSAKKTAGHRAVRTVRTLPAGLSQVAATLLRAKR